MTIRTVLSLQVSLRGHNKCFDGELQKNISKLSLLPFLSRECPDRTGGEQYDLGLHNLHENYSCSV